MAIPTKLNIAQYSAIPLLSMYPKKCLEKTLESPLDCREIQPVRSEGDQPWDFFGRNDAKAEAPVLWPPHAKSWLIGKDSDAGRTGWMASQTRWVWVNSGSWWWTGRPGVLRFMGSQRVGHDWATELNWCYRIIAARNKFLSYLEFDRIEVENGEIHKKITLEITIWDTYKHI